MDSQKKGPCDTCECKEFMSNPWKPEKCIHCYHLHLPSESNTSQQDGVSSPSKSFYTKTLRVRREDVNTSNNTNSNASFIIDPVTNNAKSYYSILSNNNTSSNSSNYNPHASRRIQRQQFNSQNKNIPNNQGTSSNSSIKSDNPHRVPLAKAATLSRFPPSTNPNQIPTNHPRPFEATSKKNNDSNSNQNSNNNNNSGLPPGWQIRKTQEGDIYYFNFATGTSSWDPPSASTTSNSSNSNTLKTPQRPTSPPPPSSPPLVSHIDHPSQNKRTNNTKNNDSNIAGSSAADQRNTVRMRLQQFQSAPNLATTNSSSTTNQRINPSGYTNKATATLPKDFVQHSLNVPSSTTAPLSKSPPGNFNKYYPNNNTSTTPDQNQSNQDSAPKMSSEDYCNRVIAEIISTEQAYIKGLEALIQEFLNPLKKTYSSNGKSMNLIATIFSNIEEIYDFTKVFFGKLTEAKENDSNHSKIGDVFVDLAPYMKAYYTKYTSNYASANSLLTDWEKSEKGLNDWLEETRLRVEGHSIRSFLILPIQRIPRYNLLLEDLLKHTNSTQPIETTSLFQASEKMKAVANDLNQAIKEGENRQKIINIAKNFVNTRGNNFVEAHRLYIRDGPLIKVCRKSLKHRWFFLFNDALAHASVLSTSGLISSNKYLLHHMFKLNHIRLEDIGDNGDDRCRFKIVTPSKSFVVVAANQEEKIDWMLDITEAIEEWSKRRQTFKEAQIKSGALVADTEDSLLANFEAPVWQPDRSTQQCPLCDEAFTMIKRRHHCRACGACICGNCSSHKVALINLGPKQVRVCDRCWKRLGDSP